jgi:XTP/dITP diphosphohydrolase
VGGGGSEGSGAGARGWSPPDDIGGAGPPLRPRVVVATRNRGKLREILQICESAGLGVELVPLDDLAPDAVLVEDEPTFEENALAKARQAAAVTRLPALADDSGLEVDALGGAPGVRSARYAGEPSDDARNNHKLIATLGNLPAAPRTARFRCAAAFVDRDRALELVATGACEGEILTAPRGDLGFGYDPLFLVPHLARTMAELPPEEKNHLSHRAAAFRALIEQLAALPPA